MPSHPILTTNGQVPENAVLTMNGPLENQFIDLHTHSHHEDPAVFAIRSLVKPGEMELYKTLNRPVSVGLHPWFIDLREVGKMISIVREASKVDHVLAIGECGLDMAIQIVVDQQTKVFIEQTAIAEESGKPLVIHCVKAYPHLLALIKQLKPTVPWIFHGFNHNEQVANDLIRHGAFLSIGSDLLRDNSKIRKSIRLIPPDRIFLETDEWQQPVSKLYAEAANILNISEQQLKAQLRKNFKSCFGL